jgi:large subunit ribosomal protein L19e
MGFKMQKKIAGQLMKCGVSRVRIRDVKAAEEALTRADIRGLIDSGKIIKLQKKGSSKFRWKKKLAQKKKGRKRGFGSRKGTKNARTPEKGIWMASVRPLRRLLKDLRDNEQITRKVYSVLYLRIKGGAFRSKSHLMLYVREHELLMKPKVKKEKTAKAEKPAKKAPAKAKKEKKDKK